MGSDVILHVRKILEGYFGGDDRNERVRRKLVETLYNQPISLLVGAIAGVACTATAMILSESPAIDIAGGLLIATALTRTILAIWLARDTRNRETRTLELAYQIGALTYALLAGLVAALAIYDAPTGPLQTLTLDVGIDDKAWLPNEDKEIEVAGEATMDELPLFEVVDPYKPDPATEEGAA